MFATTADSIRDSTPREANSGIMKNTKIPIARAITIMATIPPVEIAWDPLSLEPEGSSGSSTASLAEKVSAFMPMIRVSRSTNTPRASGS